MSDVIGAADRLKGYSLAPHPNSPHAVDFHETKEPMSHQQHPSPFVLRKKKKAARNTVMAGGCLALSSQ